jgi:hypothetical protein
MKPELRGAIAYRSAIVVGILLVAVLAARCLFLITGVFVSTTFGPRQIVRFVFSVALVGLVIPSIGWWADRARRWASGGHEAKPTLGDTDWPV